MTLSKQIIILANLPVLACFLYAFVHYRKFGQVLRTFAWFVFLSGVIQLFSLGLWFFSINNMPFLHVYVALGYLSLTWFYATLMHPYLNKLVLWFIAGVFLTYSVINSLFVENWLTFNSNALTVESILVVILSLASFNLHLNETVKIEKRRLINSLNWINSGLFIYFSSNLLLFYFADIIMDAVILPDLFNIVQARYIWVVHSFFSTVMYLCFFIGLWKQQKG